MKLPIVWLRDYLDLTPTTDELVERLAALGFPVAGIERRPRVSGVVAGRIVKLDRHPNADRLQICTVDVRGPALLSIATGATNVAAGQIVPVATLGAHLLDLQGRPLRIEPRQMRGFESQGMLASAAEFGFEGEWFEDGIMQLDATTALGTDVVALFGLNDPVLDVEVTSNRVDAMCVVGIARELAASYGIGLREPRTTLDVATDSLTPTSADLRVTLESPDCPHFVAQRFSNLTVRPAPAWMRIRLALAGQRPINNLVDISNFVMLELGQPLHFYDFEKLAGRHLIARDARDGEVVRTLDGADHTVTATALVIADEARAQGLAGLKGGAYSEVTPATRELVLEAATFAGARVRRMSVAVGLRTDASSRHEKTIPRALNAIGAARAAVLLVAEGATAHAPLAAGEVVAPVPIALTSAEIKRILGLDLNAGEIAGALRGLGFTVATDATATDRGASFAVTPPAWRGDVTIAADVIEEVGRMVGYDRIGAEHPAIVEQSIESHAYVRDRAAAHALAALGYREAVTLALEPATVHERFERAGLAPPTPVEISNPLSEDQRYLRFSLLPNLLALAAKYAGETVYGVFEIGHVFAATDRDPHERSLVTWVLAQSPADTSSWRDDGFLAAKGDALALVRNLIGRVAGIAADGEFGLHPGKTATLIVDGVRIGAIGALDPRLLAAYEIKRAVYAGTLDLDVLPAYRLPGYAAPSRFPALIRDLAVVVGRDTPAALVASTIAQSIDGVLREARVFDDYRGPQVPTDKKSIAVRIVLQRADATLTDAEADAHVQTILGALHERLGATIRT